MNHLNNYIIEKFKLNSKNMPTYSFKHIDKKDIKAFWGYNWILTPDYFEMCWVLLDYALNNLILRDNEEEFIKKFIKDIDDYNDNFLKTGEDDLPKKTEILNGKRNNGYYQRVKCIYDICKFIIYNDNFNNKLCKDIEDLIQDINNITNNEINDLDWAYNEKD